MSRRIHALVSKYNSLDARQEENDLKYTALIVRNRIIDWLRRGGREPLSIVDDVLKVSRFIKEATLTREKVKHIEDDRKRYLKFFYFEEGEAYTQTYRLPNKTDNFKAFTRKTDVVKDVAVTIVLEMYCIYRESLLSDEGLKHINERYNALRKKQVSKARNEKEKRERVAHIRYLKAQIEVDRRGGVIP